MTTSETPRRRGGGEWGPPLTAEEAAPPAIDLIAQRRATLAANAAAGGPSAPASAAASGSSAPASASPPRRGGGEWGPPLTAEEAAPPAIDLIAQRRATLAGSAPAANGPAASPAASAPLAPAAAAPNGGPRPLEPLVNFDRVREMLRRYGLDAVVCTIPHNVYYLSGLDSPPLWEFPWYAFAVVPLVGEPALVLSNLALSAPIEAELWIRDYYPVFRGELITYDASALLESEQRLKTLSEALAPRRSENAFVALAKVFRDRALVGKKVGFDDSRVVARLPEQNISPFDALELMREVRMVKTEPEIRALRAAAVANEAAALEAARSIPTAPTWEDVVRRYKAALALRGGEGRYLIGGAPHHTGTHQHMFRDYRLQRGEWFMIDALGTLGHYYGDFGRTVSWGPPSETVLRRYAALRKGFEAGLSLVKPGVAFETIAEAVRETVRREGLPAFSVCVPHSVGLEHTDMPRRPGIRVEQNMTMNLDLAYLEAGFGQLHLEDTLLVRADGPELLTSGQTELIVLA
ncbi:MAG: M24 family metallopeptidase [Chloroflexi bacterium]|nr:M24 family metallopeptidase [Chloroflexota bacterium]